MNEAFEVGQRSETGKVIFFPRVGLQWNFDKILHDFSFDLAACTTALILPEFSEGILHIPFSFNDRLSFLPTRRKNQ